jgi:hypothetical protein
MSEIMTDSFVSVVSSIGCDGFGNKEIGFDVISGF